MVDGDIQRVDFASKTDSTASAYREAISRLGFDFAPQFTPVNEEAKSKA